MKTTLALDEEQCKIIIKGLEYYCDMLYITEDSQYKKDTDIINTIYDQIPEEYFKGLAK